MYFHPRCSLPDDMETLAHTTVPALEYEAMKQKIKTICGTSLKVLEEESATPLKEDVLYASRAQKISSNRARGGKFGRGGGGSGGHSGGRQMEMQETDPAVQETSKQPWGADTVLCL